MRAAQRPPVVGLALCFFVIMSLGGDARELRDAGSTVCATIYKPVCDPATGTTYPNACVASRNNVKKTVPGECPAPPTDGCICTLEYAPVCDPATGTTYGNACTARCAGVTETVPGACSTTTDSESRRKLQGDAGATCICYELCAPVCDTLTNTNYSNACRAGCAGAMWTAPGACTDRAAKKAANCPKVPDGSRWVYDPVCVITKDGDSSAVTTSYFNPCVAKAYATNVVGSYKGLCNAAADDACANEVPSITCSNSTATEYPNACYLSALEGDAARSYPGQCQQPEALQLAARCPPSTKQYPVYQVNCFVDPCSTAKTCRRDRTAQCVSRYCEGYFRSTYLSGQCQAVFINNTGDIVPACTSGLSG